MTTALTTTERSRLRELEAAIERSLTGAARNIAEIRDARLYRESHPSFEAYCRDRWGIGRAHAYRLIGTAKAEEALSPMGDIRLNERVARELPREPAQAREVWAEAVERHGEKPTAAQVADVRREREAPPVPHGTPDQPPEPERPVVHQIAPSPERPLTPEERVARLPHVVADKAIQRIQDLVKTIEVAGGVDSIMRSLDESPLAPTVRESWAYFIARGHDVLGEWRAQVEERPGLRRVK